MNFLNLGNDMFQESLDSDIYVDKTGLAEIENNLVDDFKEAYPDIAFKKEGPIPMIKKIYDETNIKFVFIIDE